MPTICLHHNDADGRASAAIVRRALGMEVLLYEIDFGEPVPWDMLERAQSVVMVDFSLPPPEMQRLAASAELIWIDHHISALKAMAGIADNWPGLRDITEAGCVLTWKYFFPDQSVPRAIVLIGDRDIWRWAEAETGPFDDGLHQRNTNPENDDLWQPLLDDDSQLLQELIQEGKILYQARLLDVRRYVRKYGFELSFEGYRTLALNARSSGEMGAYIRQLGYQLAYCYVDVWQNDRLMTTVTLYSEQVDVSQLAQKFGGGGHRGAAGFSFQRGAAPFPPNARVVYG
jgi:oligoribonuclease NrnB/cAMP/cGMP phosphodiesterase (DHH superfamily)